MHLRDTHEDVKRKKLKIFFIVLAVSGFIMFAVTTFINQQKKLSSIREQTVLDKQEYNECVLEQQRLKYLSEFMKTDEYKAREARRRLGVIGKNDILFKFKD